MPVYLTRLRPRIRQHNADRSCRISTSRTAVVRRTGRGGVRLGIKVVDGSLEGRGLRRGVGGRDGIASTSGDIPAVGHGSGLVGWRACCLR